MSAESIDNTVKSKLIDILDEEFSALKLKKEDENEYLKHDLSEEKRLDTDSKQEIFSSSEDKTAEIQETVYCKNNETCDEHKEIKCKKNEILNPQVENTPEETEPRSENYQQRKSDFVSKEGSITSPENDKAGEKVLQVAGGSRSNIMFKNDVVTFVPPCDKLAEKILRRAESYFQDYNLFKNSFLLNHVRRNKKGYVSLKVITSLRKIKTLTRDYRVVAYSLRNSKILELNPENSKMRRIAPVPKIEDTAFGKTLMVFNLPHQDSSRYYLKDLFSKFGKVVSAGVYEIGSPESDVYHERCLHFHQRIASRIYGIVEFEKYNQVVRAIKDEEGHLPKENEMKVVPLMPQIYKKERRHLKLLEPSRPNSRREFEHLYPRDGSRVSKSEVSNEEIRAGKMNAGGYQFNRGSSRRPYRRRKPFMAPNTKNYSEVPLSDYGIPSNKWGPRRQLRSSNSFNTDRLYGNPQRISGNYV